ncbi:MAG: amino acid ABC transporter permease [Oscillatoriales cyanobacterium RM2_1_1]|nr:amino acid ABC transporter permease [Oscillatoriales cyanobacterium SM2_3_0]NJO44848.1 amino acid ABC transporter permease [Oscillatoriales cyanobacterium RM2_1_1]
MTTTPHSANFQPTVESLDIPGWLRKNLFNTWYNSLLTLAILGIFGWILAGFVTWATTEAKWNVIPANLSLFFTGRFPSDQLWRLWLVLGIIFLLGGLTWGILARSVSKLYSQPIIIGLSLWALVLVLVPVPLLARFMLLGLLAGLVIMAAVGRWLGNSQPQWTRWLPFAWFAALLVFVWLISGGLGLPVVSTNLWGGLMLTLLMSIISILLCFPLGIAMALGRQSSLPVIRWLSVAYIEVVRGLPLITILFMGQVLVPLFLPEGMRPDRVLRAIIGLTVFSSAYLAENIRGGLQAIPRGQTEAAKALGLNVPLSLGLIVLPQALKIAIPSIVGQFISLFQDTTLLAIVGLVELLGISRSILANPKFLGRYSEVYIFIGILYWLFCYAMSMAARRLEKQLNTEYR